MCAYAFMNMNTSVIMLDCWRKWKNYRENRSKWKTVSWKFQILWHETKMKGEQFVCVCVIVYVCGCVCMCVCVCAYV